ALPCSLGDLQPGDSRSVGVVFAVPPAYPGPNPIVNIAIASSPTISTRDDGNTARAETNVTASADVALTKTGPPAAAPGLTATYTLTVTNAGPSAATFVTLSDPAPAGLVAGTVSGDCTALPCAIGSLLPGDSRTVNVSFAVPAAFVAPNPIVNTATVT